uniref:Uncharacterized protein n=1 Tax=Erythrolobus australicus TaxID=1077150 RepID=A0A7S1XGI7_9RHOD|mmetsp:Transcript_2087/g.5614  ORF Transcript_2087/g.5614 Transcript_2087/m.5614 type:complete len:495 (+) Transcript_2087:103-1587(+)
MSRWRNAVGGDAEATRWPVHCDDSPALLSPSPSPATTPTRCEPRADSFALELQRRMVLERLPTVNSDMSAVWHRKQGWLDTDDEDARSGVVIDDDDDDDDDNDSKGGESDDDNFVEAKGEQRPIAEVISEPDLRIYDDEAARENDGSMDAQRGSEASNLVEEMKRAARAPQKAVDESRERQIAAAASAAAEAIGGMPAGSLPAPTRTLYGRLGYTPSVILDPARPGFTSNVAAAVANNPTKASPAAGFGGETKFEVAESAAAANSAAQRPRHISDLKPQAFIAASMLDETGSADSPANSQRSVLETETLLKDPASALNEGMRQDSQVSVDENGGAHGSGGSSKATSRRNSLLGSKQKKAASNSGGAKRNVSNKVMALFSRATSRGSSAAVANTRFMSHFEPSQCFLEMGRLMTRMGGDVARKRDAHELKVRVLFQERQVHAKIDVVRAADTSGSGSLVTFRKAPGEPFDAALHQAFFDEVRAQFAAIGDGAVSA